MWTYEKKLQYPVKIARPNPALAKVIITQFGGPDGEMAAANRYLSQRYSMPYGEVTAVLTDIGTEAPFLPQKADKLYEKNKQKTSNRNYGWRFCCVRAKE